MPILATSALGFTLALLFFLIGVGIIVNLLVVYIAGGVMAERRANKARKTPDL
jgi:hypothetical protein